MKRLTFFALALTVSASAWCDGTTVLGGGAGKVRATNSLAAIGSGENALEWSRRDFQDGQNFEVYGFWPNYTISNASVDAVFGDFFTPNLPATVISVDSLVSAGWPATFTVPQFLFRQGGSYTNNSLNGNHSPIGPVWIKYELGDGSQEYDIKQVKVFPWEIRDVLHKSSATKVAPFSDTGAPAQIDVYVSTTDSNPNSSPIGNAEWTLVGSVSKAGGTILDVCAWDAGTNNTFGETPQSTIAFLSGNNPQGLAFYNDPTNDLWYSKVNANCARAKYVALVIPIGNQYGQDATLAASNRTSSSLRYTNFTDVRVVACKDREPGDANGDGCVNDADLLIVLFNFGSSNQQADLNGDGIVNDVDLLLVLFNFGSGC